MSTPRSGSPDTENEVADVTPKQPSRRGVVPLILTVIVLALALYAASQVFGVLYGILFPPSPPRPASLTEVEHTSAAYGVDEWQYSTSDDACTVTRFYQSNGGTCILAPTVCDAGFLDSSTMQPGENVAQCSGEIQFSAFAMSWEAIIAGGYREGDSTRFKLSREVFWTGAVPPPIESIGRPENE